jgi:hypothetical protein
MQEMSSPWTSQMRDHIHRKIETPVLQADHVIIWAGISWITTAYYILKHTKHSVTIVEKGKIAHWATWHNAGQVAAYFDTPFDELVYRYGLDASIEAYEDVRSAWVKLEEILMRTKIPVRFSSFVGHAGCITQQDLHFHLERKLLRQKKWMQIDAILVSQERLAKNPQQAVYQALITPVPHATILDHLQTNDTRYIAALAMRKGTMNSALFCEELLNWMLARYPNRIDVYTHTKVNEVHLHEQQCIIDVTSKLPRHTISANRIILATNWFVNLTIRNHSWKAVNKKFSKNVSWLIWYMAWYIDTREMPATAISYFVPKDQLQSDNNIQSYYYLTRRPFSTTPHDASLVCLWWPEKELEEHEQYHHDLPYPAEILEQLTAFMHHTYRYAPQKVNYTFHRHGLMWFTNSWVRIAWPEPENNALYYNVWCNGVGIMSAIYGARKISQLLLGKKMKKSIFDPL